MNESHFLNNIFVADILIKTDVFFSLKVILELYFCSDAITVVMAS